MIFTEHFGLVADFNAKHTAWGGEILNCRGDLLMEICFARNLEFLYNLSFSPTFQTSNGPSWIDLR